jgi:alkylhydroperoxidase/carboxymuconolactone decarboxylase family protein YurZ
MVRWTMEFVFASVWLRPKLERKQRSIATIGMLIALRQHEELQYHTKMGIKNGLTRDELEEIVYTAVPYAGMPAAQQARKAMLQAFAELDAA